MYFPIYHIPKFFDEPEKITKWANSLEYNKSTGNYPGQRTGLLSEVAPKFFKYSTDKICHMIYGQMQKTTYSVASSFQKISYDDIKHDNNKGWIHADNDSLLTVIVYLTPNLTDSGTSIYKTINEGHGTDVQLSEQRKLNYKGKKINKDEYKKDLENNNSNFELLSTVHSKFNSAIAFDGCYPHGAHFNLKPGETRLTLTMFFKQMGVPYFPMAEVNRNNF